MTSSSAPDDDPEFLGRIGPFSDQDERIRRLEEELALLDAEADDPPKTHAPDGITAVEDRPEDDGDSAAPDPDADGPRRGSIG